MRKDRRAFGVEGLIERLLNVGVFDLRLDLKI